MRVYLSSDDLQVVTLSGDGECGAAIDTLEVHIRTRLNQERHDVMGVTEGSLERRRGQL